MGSKYLVPRNPLGDYCDGDEPSAYRPNLPEEDRLLLLLRELLDVIPDVRRRHDEAHPHPSRVCDCDICTDLDGLLYNVTLGESLLGGMLHSPPEDTKRRTIAVKSPALQEDASSAEPLEVMPPRLQPQKPRVYRPHPLNPPGTERACNAMQEALDAFQELYRAHGTDCTCDSCIDAAGIAYTLRLLMEVLSSTLYRHVDLEETAALLARMEAKYGTVEEEATSARPPADPEPEPKPEIKKGVNNPFYRAG